MMRQVAFLLMILASASGFLKKPRVSLTLYQQFVNFSTKHIMVDRMPVGKCFNVLKEKRINQEGQKCKKINTFIHAPLEDVVKVCEVGEMQKDEMKKSIEKFNMTVCSATKQGKFPNCTYEGKIIKAKILIKCLPVISLPVHFHDSPNNGHSEVLFWSEK
ncbi:unnamed protein product [Knipowitschia caucasica]